MIYKIKKQFNHTIYGPILYKILDYKKSKQETLDNIKSFNTFVICEKLSYFRTYKNM